METALPILWKLLLVAVLVLLNGFFVAAEFALVKVRETQLAPLIVKGHRGALITRRVVGNLDASLSACQLGITLASLGLGWVGEPVFAALLQPLLDAFGVESEKIRHSLGFLVGFSVLTFLHISAGEQAPKWLAIQKPLPTSLWVARPLELFHRASYPFIYVLNAASLWMLRRLGVEPAGEGEGIHSPEELRLMIAASQKRTGGTALGRDITLNALDLSERIVREVMRPRREIVALNTEDSVPHCLDVVEQSRFSRFPICEEGDLDRTLGVIHIKDLYALRMRAKSVADFVTVARRLIYVPPSARLEKLLQLFLERRLHLAMVVDEYGGTIGMVTLENILEELVGQIQDEFDQETPLIQPVDENTWELDGAYPLHELAELMGQELEEEDISTVSGWMTHRLEGFPQMNDIVESGGWELQVKEMDGKRVSRLMLMRRPPPVPSEGDEPVG